MHAHRVLFNPIQPWVETLQTYKLARQARKEKGNIEEAKDADASKGDEEEEIKEEDIPAHEGRWIHLGGGHGTQRF